LVEGVAVGASSALRLVAMVVNMEAQVGEEVVSGVNMGLKSLLQV
jgi:hypothetical protein